MSTLIRYFQQNKSEAVQLSLGVAVVMLWMLLLLTDTHGSLNRLEIGAIIVGSIALLVLTAAIRKSIAASAAPTEPAVVANATPAE